MRPGSQEERRRTATPSTRGFESRPGLHFLIPVRTLAWEIFHDSAGARMPRGYGFVTTRRCYAQYWIAWIPLNIVLRFGVYLWNWIKWEKWGNR